MATLPPIPPPPAKVTLEVHGLRELRGNLTQIIKEADLGKEIIIFQRGFDRRVKAKYKLVKVDDLPQ